jgi:hypothetical protein
MAPLGIVVVEASRWEMAPLRELLSWQWIQSESLLSEWVSDWSHPEVSTFELEHQNLTEELLDIEGNMIDHWTADMFDGTIHEIVEHNFQDLELATRY